MTPIIGLLIAIVAGLLAPRPRTAAAIVVAPMLGATAAQSWYLGSGRGHNPASTTTNSPAYWVVQLLIIAAICGVAAAICWVRTRRSRVERVLPGGSLGVALLAIATVAACATTVGYAFVTDRPKHPGTGNGNPPIAGTVAIFVGAGVLIVAAVIWFRNSRRLVVA
jgi:hypothetical protein